MTKKSNPYQELLAFTDEYGFTVELDKPFSALPQLILRVLDKESNELAKMILEDIAGINKGAAKILNDLSKATK